MADALLTRILRESGVPNLVDILSERLSPTDLQSLLLEVMKRRAEQRAPSTVLHQYESSRFVTPSVVPQDMFALFDCIAFETAAATPFAPLEISPVAPLGCSSAIAPISQNVAVATVRGTEVVSDSTNVLALECALRRRTLMESNVRSLDRVRLCTSHRLLRGQKFDGPEYTAHFRAFAVCTAGRDEGSERLEWSALAEQIDFWIRLLNALSRVKPFAMESLEVKLIDRTPTAALTQSLGALIADLRGLHNHVRFTTTATTEGGGYYPFAQFKLLATIRGKQWEVGDGGFTDWTQKLLNNRKERLLISGFGTELFCKVFVRETRK